VVLDPKELGEWSRKIVEVYMQWYTYFLTSNLLVMSWFYSKENGGADTRNLVLIARLFQCLDFLGTVSTVMVGYYVSRAVPDFSRLIVWAASANACGLLGIAYVWQRIIRATRSK
jgi:hypothetical protein